MFIPILDPSGIIAGSLPGGASLITNQATIGGDWLGSGNLVPSNESNFDPTALLEILESGLLTSLSPSGHRSACQWPDSGRWNPARPARPRSRLGPRTRDALVAGQRSCRVWPYLFGAQADRSLEVAPTSGLILFFTLSVLCRYGRNVAMPALFPDEGRDPLRQWIPARGYPRAGPLGRQDEGEVSRFRFVTLVEQF